MNFEYQLQKAKHFLTQKNVEQGIILALGFFLLFSLAVGVTFTSHYVNGAVNVTNQTVLAIVNITNTEPNITSVIVDDYTDTPAGEIDLTANNATTVFCNATIFDFNGWQDIASETTAAVLFMQSIGPEGTEDNNHLYVNNSCNDCRQGSSASEAICSCQFAVQYYANDSNEWMCQFNATDSGGTALESEELNLTTFANSSTVTVTKLLAIDTGQLIDYGNLSVTQTSSEIIHNVSNVGNINLNVSLRGFGGENETEVNAINYTMICDFGNISWDQQRYQFGSQYQGATSFDTMFNLTNQTRNVINSTLPQKTEDNAIGHETNTSLWRLQVPLSVGGLCNGTIIFGAVDAEV